MMNGGGFGSGGGGGGQTQAIRRIQRELKEISDEPSRHWTAAPSGDDMFEWNFVMRGPPGTEFEEGIYTGRLALPVNYPLAPPSIMLLTPNGRWEVSKKICLSNSSYHPELWQPAWGIRTMMEALRSHFSVPGDGAIGALDWPEDLRRQLATESLDWVLAPGKRPNRELLPELTPEEIREGQLAAATLAPIAAPEVTPTPAPAPVPPPAPVQPPLPDPQPRVVAPTPEVAPQEGLRQRNVAGGDAPVQAPLVGEQASGSGARRRARGAEGVRTPRRPQSALMQILQPPQTKRQTLIVVVDLLILMLVISFFFVVADMIIEPPKVLDSQRIPKGGSSPP